MADKSSTDGQDVAHPVKKKQKSGALKYIESFMMISIESEILRKISSDKAVENLAIPSKEMNRLLILSHSRS